MKLSKHHQRSLAPVSGRLSSLWPVQRLQHHMDRLMNHAPFDTSFLSGLVERAMMDDWHPAISVHEEENSIVVKAEVPGMRKEEFQVYITGDNLNISGERKDDREEKTENSYHSERYFGRFHRMIPLPVPVRAEAIEARYKDGILTVTCPKTETAKRKHVDVKFD